MHFSLLNLLTITTVFALVIAVAILVITYLDTINYPVAVVCAAAIPTAPFIAASIGALTAYRKLSAPKKEALLIGSIVRGFIGVSLSLFCFLLLGHIASKYW